MERARRTTVSNKQTTVSQRLAEMKAARTAGTSRINQIQLKDEGDLYEEMTEEQYNAYVLQQRQAGQSFVEDDMDGLGYGDDDNDIWDEEGDDYYDDGDGKRRISKVAQNPNKRSKANNGLPVNHRVANAFLGAGSRNLVGPGTNKSVNGGSNGADLAAIDDLLGKLDEDVVDAEIEDQQKAQKMKQRQLTDLAMFAQPGKLAATFEEGVVSDINFYNPYQSQRATKVTDQFNAPPPSAVNIFADNDNEDENDMKIANLMKVNAANGNGADAGEYDDAVAGKKFKIKQEPKTEKKASDDLLEYDPVDGNSAAAAKTNGNMATGAAKSVLAQSKAQQSSVPASKFNATSNHQQQKRSVLPPTQLKVNPKAFDWYKLLESGSLDRDNLAAEHTAAGNITAYPSEALLKSTASPVDEAGNLQLYYLDVYEDSLHARGSLFLFGKALLSDGRSTASCAVHIKNMERNIYFLPRKYALNASAQQSPTEWDETDVSDSEVKPLELYTEIKEMLNRNGIKNFKSKMVTREYAFDREYHGTDSAKSRSLLDPANTVPAKTQYMKVVYSYADAAMPRNIVGRTFSCVFNTRASALETFLLKRDLMGPQWLTVAQPQQNDGDRPFSWCKFEYIVTDSKTINVTSEPPETPLLSLTALNLKTTLNNKNKHEIACVTLMTHPGVNVDGPTQNEHSVQYTTYLTKLSDWSMDTNQMARSINARKVPQLIPGVPAAFNQRLVLCSNELELLNKVMMAIHQLDVDILVGHDLHAFGIEMLMSRCRQLKVSQWSKIGRLRRSKIPQQSNNNNETQSTEFCLVDRGIGCGRLMADTMVTSKELLNGQRSYTLSQLAMSQLDGVQVNEIESLAVKGYYNEAITSDLQRQRQCDKLLQLIRSNENEAFLALRLMYQIELLPLTKQLTNLCGNLWYRTMRASRAERVEYLLLHEFYRLKYICPEKYTSKERKERQARQRGDTVIRDDSTMHDDNEDGDNDGKKAKGGKPKRGKPQYSGGLVLEPKKGFYDKCVLLLDFNSLYPSIIQEYNICFTTVQHFVPYQHDNAGAADTIDLPLPPLPSPAADQGKLPAVLKKLINRRSAVKQLIKSERNVSVLKQLDIRQKALKLVANSMYGCLGFVASRFYCEPLASLVTAKGRETLQSTVDLIATLGLNVIYGDTDSVMIDTNESQLDRVVALGKQIQTEVNKRHKVLELGLDGIFRHMLLLRKKKYAALVVQPDGSLVRETKGLDLVRRDWCDLSRSIGNAVLDSILDTSGKRSREDVVNQIHAILETTKDEIANNRVPLAQYIITKSLTKAPHEYGDAKSQPHVQVALNMIAAGQKASSGDIIPYVICQGEATNIAQRAFHPKAVEAAGGALQIDTHWYKTHQLLPPIVRLCAVMEETDAARLAHCLGLDSRLFQSNTNSNNNNQERADQDAEIIIVNSLEDDAEKFRGCKQLHRKCTNCSTSYPLPGVYHWAAMQLKNPDGTVPTHMPALACGLQCPNKLCQQADTGFDLQTSSLQLRNQLTSEVRRCIQSYYTSEYQCSDASCARKTRSISMKSNKCSSRCNGRLNRIYSHETLYLQLSYYTSLFDISRADLILQSENKRRREAAQQLAANTTLQVSDVEGQLSAGERQVLQALHSDMKAVMDLNAYHWVSLADLFSFAAIR